MTTRFGYACLNTTLSARKPKVNPNRGMIKRTWEAKGLPLASERALLNVQDLLTMVRWNRDHDIQVFRITSNLIPWSTEYELEDLPAWDAILATLQQVGQEARDAGQRLSFHPGQHNVLASPNPQVVENTLRDLRTHGELMDAMGMPRDRSAKINVHVGGAYGEPDKALARFCKAADRLPESVRSRFTVENDDRQSLYSVKMLWEGVYRHTSIPIVFDSHHFELGPQDQDYADAFELAVSTWAPGIRPCCHHSNSRQLEDPAAPAKAHSQWYYTPFDDQGHSVDVVLECKMKEQALFRYRAEFLKEAA